MRFLIGILLLATATFGLAQDVLKIEFSSEAPREIWIHPTSTPGRGDNPLAVTGSSVEVPIAAANAATDAVSVRDLNSGRVAMIALKGLKSPWKPVSSDFTRLYQLDVELVHEEQPVAVAVVKLEAGSEKRQEILDESGKGIVSFFNVGRAPYRVIAEMKSDGKTIATPAQSFNPKPEDVDGGIPKVRIEVNEPVQVVSAKPTKTPKDGEEEEGEGGSKDSKDSEDEKKGEPGGGIIGTILGMILGLALLGGIGYGIYRYLQVRGTDTEAQLAKLGLGGSSSGADPAPSAPAAPAPLQKIVLGDADPTPIGMAAPAPLSTGSVATPRLVRQNGDVVLLAEGASEIGREASIPLPGETSVSRRHASIERSGASVVVNDLGSTNGTWVNGRKIDGPTALQPGDQLMLGSITFRYEV